VNTLRSKGIDKLVVDVRDNAVGKRAEMLETAGAFMESGTIASVQTRQSTDARSAIRVQGSEPFTGRLVVVVNQGTCSLAEVFAAALRERRNATLLGTRTFGDAMAHELLELSDHSGMMITTGRYYTSRGQDFAAVGLRPDVSAAGAAKASPPNSDPVVAQAKSILTSGGKG
jgi:carboxyl-terminal processing protease